MRYFSLLIISCCIAATASAQTIVEPMLTASWNQASPFNDDCPEGSAAGCGAIAVAQILDYYKLPAHGFGRATYANVDYDFECHPFDWSNILPYYTGNETSAQRQAVANLVHAVGVAMKMNYASASSPYNFPSMMWGMQHFLHISPTSRYLYRRYYSTAEWIEMINEELENRHPIFYRGDHTEIDKKMVGHMYVIDGMDSDGLYHVNFGHSSKKQDKFVNLNVINQGEGVWIGGHNVCYHHRQAMVINCFPVDGLSESDFDHAALVLTSPIVLEGQPQADVVECKGSVRAQFQFRHVSFLGGKAQFSFGFYQQGHLVDVSNSVYNTSFSDGGYGISTDHKFNLPESLPDGDYEMSLISRDDSTSPWVMGWDNVPNRIPVRVNNGVYKFDLPNYHNRETPLYLADGINKSVDDISEEGTILEMTVVNPSVNNFEDSLRLVVSANGETRQYEILTSLYDGQRITYRFAVPVTDMDCSNGYEAVAYYKETTTGTWLQIADGPASLESVSNVPFLGIEIYSSIGVLIGRVKNCDLEQTYQPLLSSLPKGIYIIREENRVRKIVKK